MKTSLPAIVISCTLVCASQLVNASEECEEKEQRNTALGHAIGVLIFDNIVKEYSEFAKVADIAVGLQHASNRAANLEAFPLSSTINFESDPEASETRDDLSVSEAQAIVTNWRPQSDKLDKRFVEKFIQRAKQKEGGVLTHPLEISDRGGIDRLSECTSNNSLSAKDGLKQVCYMQMAIDIDSVCNSQAIIAEKMEDPDAHWTYGEFDPKDVIEGWADVFKLLEADSEKFKSFNTTSEKTQKNGAEPDEELVSVLEVVIPPELAYGVKGMPGKVKTNETLWFLMAVQ